MNTTDKDIQVLEEMRGNLEALARIYNIGTSAFSKEREERNQAELTALTNILRDFKDMRENPRDEYHTMTELYEYRMLYNAHAAHGWLLRGIPVVKSWRHSDGELCFGGGWFIVSATLPTGQVSNHYKAEYWDLFQVPEVELPPEYDGHTPADAAKRLHSALDAWREVKKEGQGK